MPLRIRWQLVLLALYAVVFPACSHRRALGAFHSTQVTPPYRITRSDCDADPRVVKSVYPEFPDLLRRPGHPLEWVVQVAVKLDAKARVQGTDVVRSYGETTLNETTVRLALNTEALKAANASTYTPKVVHCKAVSSTYIYQVTFTGGP